MKDAVKILAVDTSTQSLSVSIRTDGFFEERRSVSRSMQHSERLVPIILELCRDAGIQPEDIDLFVCTRGPGSFTGLRIGMAALKGMAFAAGKPLVSVSTLEVLANCVPFSHGAVVPAIDAKKKRWYIAAFSKDEGCPAKRLMPDTDGTEADLMDVLNDFSSVLVTGPDAVPFAEILKGCCAENKLDTKISSFVPGTVAEALMECGLRKFESEGPDDIGQGPVYLRKSDAEIALEEKMKNSGEKENG